ncbi:hypothetical protein QQZ08_007999 [Neonectria magnoliae]|uniref:C2H2-type domain-containing protein n=1 Tax=Neonectria magnoliae TaxID=2732573 RepID=A0ABR1HWA5_9HYPO
MAAPESGDEWLGEESTDDMVNFEPSDEDHFGIFDGALVKGFKDPIPSQSDDIPSVNQLAARREIDGRNDMVRDWLFNQSNPVSPRPPTDPPPALDLDQHHHLPDDEVGFGTRTTNKLLPGQLYFQDNKDAISAEDYDLIASNRNWGNPPILSLIAEGTHLAPGRYQPVSSQAAMERFERMMRDTDSIVSRAASWGTQRRGIPDIPDPELKEGSVVGNILRMFRGTVRGKKPGGLFRDLQGLTRRPTSPSQLLKRNRVHSKDDETEDVIIVGERPAQPPNTLRLTKSRWGKGPIPSMNNALVSMSQSLASIGKTQSATNRTSIISPSSPGANFGTLTPSTSPTSESRSLFTKNTAKGIRKDSWADPKLDTCGFSNYPAGGALAVSGEPKRVRLDDFLIPQDSQTTGNENRQAHDLSLGDSAEPIHNKLEDEDTGYPQTKISGYVPLKFPTLEDASPRGVDENLSASVGFSMVASVSPTITGRPPSPGCETPRKYTIEDRGSVGDMLPPPRKPRNCLLHPVEELQTSKPTGSLPSELQHNTGSTEFFSLSDGSVTDTAKRPEDEDGSSFNNDQHKKRLRNTTQPAIRSRLACPYQAFETSQVCFTPCGRNPTGGCISIAGLKQHLKRKHMRSFRCSRCWRSLEDKRSVGVQSKHDTCEASQMPDSDRFMLPEHEMTVQTLVGRPAEEIWWKLFELLIVPDIQNWTYESLRSQYTPYYTYRRSEPMAQNTQSPSVTLDFGSFSNTPVSHPVHMPLLEPPTSSFSQLDPQISQHSPSGNSTPTPTGLDSDRQISTLETSSVPSSETSTQAARDASDQTQMRRNYDRLRARHSRLEEEVMEFQETARNARSDLNRVDAVIDDLLALDNLPRHIEDKLSEVSQVLEGVRKSLR